MVLDRLPYELKIEVLRQLQASDRCGNSPNLSDLASVALCNRHCYGLTLPILCSEFNASASRTPSFLRTILDRPDLAAQPQLKSLTCYAPDRRLDWTTYTGRKGWEFHPFIPSIIWKGLGHWKGTLQKLILVNIQQEFQQEDAFKGEDGWKMEHKPENRAVDPLGSLAKFRQLCRLDATAVMLVGRESPSIDELKTELGVSLQKNNVTGKWQISC
ncbi:hypothetical protein N431DRAFT_536382 [Stipitochalara longipes BDJ]|nr:hypothetical protein N431DRAFT_536382 [Stipitochalara longipes BDJ]